MPSSANMDYMGNPEYNKKVLYALTSLAVERGMSTTVDAAQKSKAKAVARAPKDYSVAIVTILASASDLTPESSDAEFIAAVRKAWTLFED